MKSPFIIKTPGNLYFIKREWQKSKQQWDWGEEKGNRRWGLIKKGEGQQKEIVK